VGGVPKEKIGVRDNEKIEIGEFETVCDPITQAKFLNNSKNDHYSE
jgi:uncharacterized metal-binding protein